MVTPVSPSLEDIRNLRLRTIEAFARELGISERTYRRLLARAPRIKNTTRRRIAETLQIAPHLVLELISPPTQAYRDQLTASIEGANLTEGWLEYDPDTGTMTPLPGYVLPPGDA